MAFFIPASGVVPEQVPQGENAWINYPDVDESVPGLFGARATILPGAGHDFHLHPEREELIYVLEGAIEQWVGKRHQQLAAGDAALIPSGMVHASFNTGTVNAVLLVVLSKATSDAPLAVDVSQETPWNTLRTNSKTSK